MCETIEKERVEATWTEAIKYIYKYEVGFKCSAIYLIKEKHLEINLSEVDFLSLKSVIVPDPDDGKEVKGEAAKFESTDEANSTAPIEEVVITNPSVETSTLTLLYRLSLLLVRTCKQ